MQAKIDFAKKMIVSAGKDPNSTSELLECLTAIDQLVEKGYLIETIDGDSVHYEPTGRTGTLEIMKGVNVSSEDFP